MGCAWTVVVTINRTACLNVCSVPESCSYDCDHRILKLIHCRSSHSIDTHAHRSPRAVYAVYDSSVDEWQAARKGLGKLIILSPRPHRYSYCLQSRRQLLELLLIVRTKLFQDRVDVHEPTHPRTATPDRSDSGSRPEPKYPLTIHPSSSATRDLELQHPITNLL